MTPGLAGFIADRATRKRGMSVRRRCWRRSAAEFDVVPERGAQRVAPRRRTWLDTFDWRLHKAGLTLEYVRRRAAAASCRPWPDRAGARRRARTSPSR